MRSRLSKLKAITNSSIAAVALAGLGSCQSAPRELARETPLPPSTANMTVVVPQAPEFRARAADESAGALEVKAQPLTSFGQNSGPRFSPDGKRVLFLSRQRANHRQAQIYELDLTRMIERRVTFHDGDDSSAGYLSDGERIIYASTTDEVKEDPYLIEILRSNYDLKPGFKAEDPRTKSVWPHPPNEKHPHELYLQELTGREIERLTYQHGFDGDPTTAPGGTLIVFSSGRAGAFGLYLLNISRGLTPSALLRPDGHDLGARISPDGKTLVWTRFTQDRTSARLLFAPSISTAAKIVELTGEGAPENRLDLHPAWHPSGQDVVFASNRAGRGFDLYLLNIETSCLKRLTDANGDELEPSLSADGTRLLFTGTQSGTAQVYTMAFNPPAKCLD